MINKIKISHGYLMFQALRLVTEAVTRYRETGEMDAEQLANNWEEVNNRAELAGDDLDAAIREANERRLNEASEASDVV
jgi:hypothetical protein